MFDQKPHRRGSEPKPNTNQKKNVRHKNQTYDKLNKSHTHIYI